MAKSVEMSVLENDEHDEDVRINENPTGMTESAHPLYINTTSHDGALSPIEESRAREAGCLTSFFSSHS
ncbi:hypothetical protein X777_14602 [Ooceraea biroi]|uniref:Uncharacterized protein n=1 Tax=Ooceraea biroi TaxID=2015173 RepID=A0A026WXV6_OOCBI|nr:hypothetical protein X777_14602 [Ooceraea biroi]